MTSCSVVVGTLGWFLNCAKTTLTVSSDRLVWLGNAWPVLWSWSLCTDTLFLDRISIKHKSRAHLYPKVVWRYMQLRTEWKLGIYQLHIWTNQRSFETYHESAEVTSCPPGKLNIGTKACMDKSDSNCKEGKGTRFNWNKNQRVMKQSLSSILNIFITFIHFIYKIIIKDG